MKILFVCMGNICRSPMAEGLFKAHLEQISMADEFIVDSAGTGAWHEGYPPDPRAIAKMAEKGHDISTQISRPLREADFEMFDLLLVMDRDNLRNVSRVTPADYEHKIHLFMDYALGRDEEIPDPYYDRGDGFEIVYNMLSEGCVGVLDKLKS